jgi:hypothetical protein
VTKWVWRAPTPIRSREMAEDNHAEHIATEQNLHVAEHITTEDND